MEASELGEFRRECAVENVVGEIEESEPRYRRDLGQDGTQQLVVSEGEVGDVHNLSNVDGESTEQIETEQVE